MKIRKLHLKNIGPFDDQEIELPPCPAKGKAEIHIFTGQNGSGKTTLLMALASAFCDAGIEPASGEYIELFEKKASLKRSTSSLWLSNGFQKRFRGRSWELEVSFDCKKSTKISTDGDMFELSVSASVFDYAQCTSSEIKYTGENHRFAVFAFSGYRQLQSQRVEAIKEPKDFKPLAQSLEFVKDYSQAHQISVNQLIANNFSKKWIESARNPAKSKKFARVLSSVEQAIFDITGWKIEFDLQTEPLNLVIKLNGEDLEFDVLPDGLRSLISWMADLLGRIDLLKWADDAPILEKNLILFLDEIEVHLHPAWQRKVLPVVQKLFKNAQIFISTHSPFVVNSVDDAWVYDLEIDAQGKTKVAEVSLSKTAYSYQTVLRETFGIDQRFGGPTQKQLEIFLRHGKEILQANGNATVNKKKFLAEARKLARQSAELQSLVMVELLRLSKQTGEPYEI